MLVMLAAGTVACTDTGSGRPDPDQAGDQAVATEDATVGREGRVTRIRVYRPAPLTEPAPLLVFLPGLLLETAQYGPLLERVASHGVVVIGADLPVSLAQMDQPALALDARAVIDWALDPAGRLAGQVDAERIALAGHSLGGKVSTLAALADPRVVALLAVDPVSSGGAAGGFSETNPDVIGDGLERLVIPAAFAGETTNGTGGVNGQPCAPADGNFERFFAAATAAPWAARYDFLGADHIDFVWDQEDCLACLLCEPGTAAPAAVQAGLATLLVAFLRRHLLDERAMDAWLAGDGVPEGVSAELRVP
jgi:pimeloyl-ACP methyl ester carboxylesterase